MLSFESNLDKVKNIFLKLTSIILYTVSKADVIFLIGL